ncbi:MAG: hypothetical protein WBA74_15215 [Cyclobacteriaceae bacterium]
MENIFKIGDIVYAKIPKGLKLIVKRYVNQVYHCKVYNHPGNREITYVEDELKASTNPAENKRQ